MRHNAHLAKNLGRVLVAKRHKRKLSQADLAQAVPMDAMYLSTVERGGYNVTLAMLCDIAIVLDECAAEIVFEAERDLISSMSKPRRCQRNVHGEHLIRVIGRGIADARRANGMSQIVLSKNAGLARSYLAEMEAGANWNPTILMLHNIGVALGSSGSQLIAEVLTRY